MIPAPDSVESVFDNKWVHVAICLAFWVGGLFFCLVLGAGVKLVFGISEEWGLGAGMIAWWLAWVAATQLLRKNT